jgi:glutamate N-acetyltransferase/amino-acid N-acetyltransferase
MTSLRGFKTSAVAAGIKVKDRLDLALIYSETPAETAAVFTQNLFIAAPLIVTRRNLEKSAHRMRAVLVNSGNANAATGEAGLRAAQDCVDGLAAELRCGSNEIVVSSTGVIGRPLPVATIRQAIPALVHGLSPGGVDGVARAIMTTDTVPKTASAEVSGAGIVGVAKGAGMIHPDMATMLSFVMTDAALSHAEVDKALRYAVHHSFNSISVDGDTSTNDMVVLMANGASGVRVDPVAFQEKLLDVCVQLATSIVRDGEGATKFVELTIEGAPSEEAARTIGKTIARSPLVKTAIYGADPNWGRIVGAIGNAGVPLSSDRVDIYIGGILVTQENLDKAREKLSASEIQIRVALHSGSSIARVWTCDLTPEYIHINADYTT